MSTANRRILPYKAMGVVIALVVGFITTQYIDAELVNCPAGYKRNDNLCYKFVDAEKTWDGANSFCKSNGGQELISWNNDDDTGRFIQGEVQGNSAWIGLKGHRLDNRFYWMNGQEYPNNKGLWAQNEPSTPSELCVEIDGGKNQMLNDLECGEKRSFVCKACSQISKCTSASCVSGPDSRSKCSRCEFTYIPSTDSRHCERACEYSNPCWPGTCAHGHLKECRCSKGFQRIDEDGKNHCQLDSSTRPEILTCIVQAFVNGGKRSDSKSNSSSSHCDNMQDFYGNFKPDYINCTLETSFIINTKNFSNSSMLYQTTTVNFGVTDVKLTVLRIKPNTTDGTSTLSTTVNLEDNTQGKGVKDLYSNKENFTINSSLEDGDRLCLKMTVKGGGYMETKNTSNSSINHEYDKTETNRQICYIMDTSKPIHSSNKTTISPLSVSDRITRNGFVSVSFHDWLDPIPPGGDTTLSSGIEHYEVSLWELNYSNGTQSKGSLIPNTTQVIYSNEDPVLELNLTAPHPRLILLLLQVKDHADNLGTARRFILYDASSSIKTDTSKTLTITSASPASGFTWQTHHNKICLSWKDYFYNEVYVNNHFLDPIAPEPDITGEYEQESGDISVKGTPNVYGIVGFNISWSRNDSDSQNEERVQDFLNQTFCKQIPLKDGETYVLNITAIDIVNNTYSDSRTVSIDRSVPHINDLWLISNGYESLFAQGNRDGDLTEINISFHVLDPHSGIQEIQWAFGITDSGQELISKNISINETESCDNIDSCICPSVGSCQITKYIVRMGGNVLPKGNHNRNYYFTVKATNYARLSNIEHVQILVDTSPPEIGVVQEGPFGFKDIDYTSSHTFMVHWQGFVDHESGIKSYRIAMAEKCLTTVEMRDLVYLFQTNETVVYFKEVPGSQDSVRLDVNFTGKYFISVAALNNAAQLSEVVCSDGITRDESPPSIENITLTNSRWQESLHCDQDGLWLLHKSFTKIRLSKSSICKDVCENATSYFLPSILKERHVNSSDMMVEEFICTYLDTYSSSIFLYLPSDHIELSWDLIPDESQIEDVEVGFGRDESEYTAPSLVAYQTTNKHSWFKRNRAGFATADPFYIFVKAVNKAGLQSFTTLGPIVIDESPPIKRDDVEVSINASHVIVSWNKDTFVDFEQPEPVSSIFFQIESGGNTITPVLEWNQYDSEPCRNGGGGCIKYPLRYLQNKDTENGREFRFVLFVYNNAGHSLKTTTRAFRVPSKFPPGQGTILDIDPSNRQINVDSNIHTTESTLCVAWTGFRHHENISLEIGVGYKHFSDHVYPFRHVPNNGSSCIQSSKFLANIKHFVTLRATCTGGSTLSGSDGVIIINETELVNSLKVNTGLDCKSSSFIQELHLEAVKRNLTFDGKLRVGQIYYLHIARNRTLDPIDVVSSDAFIRVKEMSWFEVIPISEHPQFTIMYNESTFELTASIRECRNGSYVDKNNKIHGHWTVNSDINLSLAYEIAVGEDCETDGSNMNCIIQSSIFKTEYSTRSASIRLDNPESQHQYRVLVRPCIDSHCLQFATSPVIIVQDGQFNFEIQESTLENSGCLSINIKWFVVGESNGLRFFQWTISKDEHARHRLLNWTTVMPKEDKLFKIRRCVELPTVDQETMYTCVQVYTAWDSKVLKCLQVRTKLADIVPTNKPFEFDASLTSWGNTRQLLGSFYLGDRLVELLDNELDFGNVSTQLSVASTMAYERNVSWYIMTSKFVPATCASSAECLTSLETSSEPYAIFQKNKIPTNRILYSCAYSNSTTLIRENGAVNLEEMNYCSDGFVIDTVNPIGGEIDILNHNRYITDIRHSIVYWKGFKDNVDVQKLGYTDAIKYFTIFAGSVAGGDDLHRKTNVGQMHSYIFDDIQNEDGTNIFITVTATDYAGLETSVSSDSLILDSSPPEPGIVQIKGSQSTTPTISSDNLVLHLSEFEDPHSGLDYFEIGFGKQNYVTDMLSFQNHSSNFLTLDLHNLNLLDGISYFVIVQAVNKAGLKSKPVSKEFLVDRTPPAGGHVCDGNDDTSDLDYQDNTTYIAGHWYGFYDQHTSIEYYRVGLGSLPFGDDLEEMVDVGLRTSVEWHLRFEPGMKYFITVESCNKAGLCTKLSSDGIIVDHTCPIPGLVRVGHVDRQGKYQSKNDSVHIQWTGFSDPESGIDHFEVCLGTIPDLCDIYPFVNYLLSSSITKTGLNIPLNRNIYATVRATNKVGKAILASSDAFRVDTTPPEVVDKPTMVLQFNSIHNSNIQYDPSVLRAQWKFKDDESPIVNHYLTIKTHHEGHTPIEYIDLGAVDRITLSLDNHNWLLSGDVYHVVVTSCNAAGLCSFAESTDVLIDATAPHQGGFTSDLKWENFRNDTARVFLNWHSFLDAESGIRDFFVTVSRNYSGSELSNGIVTIPFQKNTTVQNGKVFLTEELHVDDKIFLSIWAQNWAGLNSSVARIFVNTLAPSRSFSNLYGLFKIEKHSCQSQYCSGDCTCAVVGRPCEKSSCTLNNTESELEEFHLWIYWGLPHMVETITTSTACLAAHWNITITDNKTVPEILRYEFSIGEEGEDYGVGIFKSNRIPWIDVGQRQETVYCLTPGMHLIHGESYVFYVRVWFSRHFYQTYHSAPLIIDQTQPKVREGAHVKDSDMLCQKDYDVIDWMDTITACWGNVFSEQEGDIIYYTVVLGTSAGVDDIIQTQSTELNTSITFTNLKLQHGTKYFFTITAFNKVDLQASLSSDGFLIDMDKPRTGVVFNTEQYRNVEYQSHTSIFPISWNGFSDDQSSIESYSVALVEETDEGNEEISKAMFEDTGLKTEHTFRNVILQNGRRYKGLVKAVDGAGHESEIASSRPKKVDTTAPEGFTCDAFSTIDEKDIASLHTTFIGSLEANFTKNDMYKIDGYLNVTYSENAVLHFENGDHRLRLPFALNHDGALLFEYNFLSPYEGFRNISLSFGSASSIIHGKLSLWKCDSTSTIDKQGPVNIKQLNPSQIAVNVLVRDLESSLYKVLIGVGTTQGGFQVRPLQAVSGGNNGLLDVQTQHGTNIHVTVIAENHAGLRSNFYSKPITFDLTGPVISDVKGKLAKLNDNGTNAIPVVADIEWTVVDKESGLKKCYCSFGRLPLSEDLLQWKAINSSACSSGILMIPHGTRLYGNIRCINNVELQTKMTSPELVVVIEPPSAEKAMVIFIPTNKEDATEISSSGLAIKQSIQNYIMFSQSSLHEVVLEWSGFDNIDGITSYKYRLLGDGGRVLIDFTDTNKTMVGLKMKKGQLEAGKTYTAEVLAVNGGVFKSPAKTVDIYVDDKAPRLTGRHIRVTQLEQFKLNINWKDVFDPHPIFPCYYSVAIGTKAGQADVADISYSEKTEAIVNLPATGIDAEQVQELFIRIECRYPTGMSASTVHNYKINS